MSTSPEMESSALPPSLLVFGPQTKLPSPEIFGELRQILIEDPRLARLQSAVKDLPRFWKSLVVSDPSLSEVPGGQFLGDIQQWIADGVVPNHIGNVPNIYALPVTILLQIALYIRYLSRLAVVDPHRFVLDGLKAGGVQGFCIGFLTAVAVACSENEEEIAAIGAVCLRLAVCMGAYVDRDGCFADPPNKTCCLAVRWKSGDFKEEGVINLIQTYPDAYISSINDEACVTITARAQDVSSMTEKLQAHGMRTKTVHVQGRFHSAVHTKAAERITHFPIPLEDMRFPTVGKIQVPLRSTLNDEVITTGSLYKLALESVLLKPADWYGTMKAAILHLPATHNVAAFVGFGNDIPASLLQIPGLQVLSLSNSQGSNGIRPVELPPGIESNNASANDVSAKGAPANGTFVNGTSINGTFDGTLPNMQPEESSYPPHSIAVVGMAGRFPGADSLDEFWQLLLSGASMVEPAPVEKLMLPQTGDHSGTKWWGNFLRNSDTFDHRFFKKSSREAIAWDPQLRVLLEVVYEAMESSGYFGVTSKSAPSDYGCYIGSCMNNYYDNVSCHPATAYATLGTSRCFFSGSISHYFGWTGPSLTIDTACSSSLVAINTACRAIMSGECSRAIAGGTNIFTSPFDYQNLKAAGFLSPTGQCKPFDVLGDGYCRGEGVGVVVLKPLATALEEKDNILGVIVGSAANQNVNCSHITVPHSGSQNNLYKKVMNLAGVTPESVSYVEAHGTGTGVGDPVECRSIREAFGGPQREHTLHFGSVKGNIGHTEATAGVAGLIKVLLMMQHGKIPAQASHSSLNPKIPPLEVDRMEIPRDVLPWNSSSRIACVNSYGAAGSNAAVMVRQRQNNALKASKIGQMSSTYPSKYPLFLSAASPTSLSMYSEKLLKYVRDFRSRNAEEISLSDLMFNLADRANHSLPHIFSTMVTDLSSLETNLAAAASGSNTFFSEIPQKLAPVVLVFGGQESEFVGISENLYQASLLFRHHLDECDNILKSLALESLYPAIFQHTPISNLVTLHTALFSVQYSSAKTWMDCGLEVGAVVGHSFGQLTALCISGCLSLKDALKLVAGRASIMLEYWGPEQGSMLWLQATQQKVHEIINTVNSQGAGDLLEVACYNGPNSHVVVGSAQSIQALEKFVASNPSLRDSVRTKVLKVTHGFHSKFTEPLLPYLTILAEGVTWRRPKIHLETCDDSSSVSEPDSRLIAEHTRRPVFFEQAVRRLVHRYSQCTWLEAGRGSSVMQLVRGCLAGQDKGHLFLSPQLTTSNAVSSVGDITANLWKAGYAVQYWLFHRCQKQQYQFLTLPPYQFEKIRHWLPFTGRGEIVTPPESVEEIPKHELLSFIKFNDKSRNEAIFRVDPQSDRFQTMLKGHVMAGQSLAPASLYFELAARAAISLYSDATSTPYVPCVESLQMKSPIGLDSSKEILLCLTSVEDSQPIWSFSISTVARQNIGGNTGDPFQHSTGTVYLTKRNDFQAAQNFKRFERLIGSHRYEDIVNHPEAELMQGDHIYRAFNHIVHYGKDFRGIRKVASVGLEAAGRVAMSVDPDDPPDQRLCDTPMTDSFMQFAGFLVNYFNNPSLEDVLVCSEIERIEIGGNFSPDAKEWEVYATMTEDGDSQATSDAYVFEAESKKLVMVAFGFHFSKMSQSLLARMLKGVNRPSDIGQPASKAVSQVNHEPPTEASEGPSKISSGNRSQVMNLLHNVTDIPLEELKDESTLEDLGIDSLMATEVLNDIRATFGVTIDLTTLLFFPNIRAIWTLLDSKLGNAPDTGTPEVYEAPKVSPIVNPSCVPADTTSFAVKPPTTRGSPSILAKTSSWPTFTHTYKAFEEIQYEYDRYAIVAKATDFWKTVYPKQARLVLAYVVEAFAVLGCHMKSFRPGDLIPEIHSLAKHKKLVRQLYNVLEDANLTTLTERGFVRTNTSVDTTPAETIYREVLQAYPEHADVHKLVKVIGSQLAACLAGEQDGLQLIFGDKTNKKTLEDMYEYWPLLRTPTLLLGEFLLKAFSNSNGSGKFRILEIGAGTGGTTRYIVNHLRSNGIPFEYTFTDLSASLVAAAKKHFKGVEGMKFEVLDIEKAPPEDHMGAFHVIIATNCIHATRRLDQSLPHLRKMLREDGVLTLVEITRNMYWLDIVVGLFEGWWLFEDGRSHALISETHWERFMKDAGFQEVAWTDGSTPESGTVRIIAGFPSARPDAKRSSSKRTPPKISIETVVYKQLGSTSIHADVYYPLGSDATLKKMPIALMIHGGSHMIFSRKDIRPAQTRLLIEKGFLPVSIDYRLCPEVNLSEGPMVDACDALAWARYELPQVQLPGSGIQIDGERVVVVGWSSGGQLAMSLAWTAPQKGLKPPEAILAFYCPTDYEDEWWRNPIQPRGAEDAGDDYDILGAIKDEPITNYGMVGAWEPLSDPKLRTDDRCRIILHINWKAQTLPVIIEGLPSKQKVAGSDVQKYHNLPQPAHEKVLRVSPLAHIVRGNYHTPTFLVHGTDDDLIPWQQSQRTYDALVENGVMAGLALVEGAPHICDLSSDPDSEGWKAALKGYEFISSFVL
ncbi:beta-ketoacyl synthase [Lepidopterella palustris CBS 459.81]|uniref:Beta-ketoacyl synthase n=1 Tax=Lepidopterella palustris CBS 459.81 TaxID=1314670 RepID=A0A8E2JGU3_9PEZI|nr:beta-ketoacyl synthase [Lepidopterella palustris CBS 459.81]